MLTLSAYPHDHFIHAKWTGNDHKESLIERLEHFIMQALLVGLQSPQDYTLYTETTVKTSSVKISLREQTPQRADIADLIHLLLGTHKQFSYSLDTCMNRKLAQAIVTHASPTQDFELSSNHQLKAIDSIFEVAYLKVLKESINKLSITTNYRLFGLSLETFLKIDTLLESLSPKCIAITGASGSGKSTLLLELKKALEKTGKSCEILYFDSFYKKQPNTTLAQREKTDYDVPQAVDMELFLHVLRTLKSGKAISIPCYSFEHHQRTEETELKQPADYIIIDGIFTLHDARARELYHKMLYVKSDTDLVFIRRLLRDTNERGRSMDNVIQQYLATVRDNFFTYIEPTQYHAHVILANNDKYRFEIDIEKVMEFILDEPAKVKISPFSYSARLFQTPLTPTANETTIASEDTSKCLRGAQLNV